MTLENGFRKRASENGIGKQHRKTASENASENGIRK
jgi:hypothetical protein